MSLENNRKILIGSVSQALDKLLVLGEMSPVIPLLSVIIDYIEYSVAQYNAGNTEYYIIIDRLNKMVQKLKYQCPDVCIYRDRIITKLNTPPTIEGNVIELPISNSYQALNYNDVVYNYNDAENDLISKVVILSLDNENDLLIDSNPAIVNNVYQPNINFSAKYDSGVGQIFIIQNGDTEPCESNIISIDGDEYNSAISTHNVVNVHDQNGNTVFQAINNNVEELPNDTIIYIHIDTSSMAIPDQETVRDVTLDWWDDFQTDNPTFQGSLLINTVPNYQISNDYAPGRGGNGRCTISGSTILTGTVEAWIENPAEALLRQAYKEGLPTTFASESDFQTYIQDKSVIVLTFVDETHNEYHGYSNGVVFNDTVQNIYQPTPTYITDYNNYIFKVRPYLRFFKGVLYPITRVANASNDNFLLHSMAAMKATVLTNAEIDALLGPDKVADYGPTDMQTKFYDTVGVSNPYQNLPGLEGSGWEGRFDKTSPASEVLNSQEFADELNSILTDTSNVQVSVLDTIEIPSTNLGNQVETDLSLKVRDNNPQQPLYSNEATITLRYTSQCEDVPTCDGTTNQVSTGHRDTYVFTVADLTSDTNVDKVKITSVNIPNGQLKYFNLTIIPSNVPILIPIADIANGDLTYIPDSTVQGSYSIEIDYELGYPNTINFCQGENTIELTKLANPNTPATIVTEDKNIELALPTDTASTTINTTVTYTGTGGYVQFWQRISGATDVIMVNPTDEDLQLQNLKEGVYVFRITVITNEDGFITTADSTVTVTVANQAPIVDAGPDKNTTTTTATAEATASDSDGTIDVIAWTQDSGPNTATINNPATLNPTFTGLVEGVYVFRITVTDNDGATNTDIVTITVEPAPGTPPVATINLTTSMPTTGGVSFSVTGTDSDGTVVSWSLDFGDGSTVLTGTGAPQDGAFPPVFHSYTTDGNYEMVLTVTDNDGLSDTDTKSIIVNSNLNSKACISGDVYAKKNETAQAPDAILDLDVIITDKNGSPAVSGQYRIISVSSDGNTAIIDGSSGPFTNFTGNNFTINRNLEVYPQLPTANPIDEIRIEFLVSYQDGSHSFIPWVATYGLSSEYTSNDYFPPGSSGVPFFKGIYNLQCNLNTNLV